MVQEVTTTSFGKRLINALWDILFGFVFIIAAIYLVFWNEGNTLHTAQSLDQTAQVVVSVPTTPIDTKNNMRAIYITGMVNTNQFLIDAQFNVSEKALKLHRLVEMYQWQENKNTTTEKEIGGSEKQITNYTYKPIWSSDKIDSATFKEAADHQNPSAMLLQSQVQYAQDVTLGDFKIPNSFVQQISGSTVIPLNKANTTELNIKLNKPVKLIDDTLYFGDDPSMPKVGDLRVTMTAVLPRTVSIIAQQIGQSLQAYMPPAGSAVSLIEMGQISPQEMILHAKSQNNTLGWILRFAALIMMILGFYFIMNPIKVLADILPFLGSLVSIGTGFIALMLGFCLWIFCLALAWFIVRPLLSIAMVLMAFVISVFCIMRKRSSTKTTFKS